MVDLDSNPTKLIEIVEVGKQLLITRGSLTTFSIANDVAKYFAILPAMFAFTYATQARRARPARTRSTSCTSARRRVRSSRRSCSTRSSSPRSSRWPCAASGTARSGQRRSCAATCSIYGLGGVILPFVGIKLIDLVVHNLLGA